jgi:hypothetical protein
VILKEEDLESLRKCFSLYDASKKSSEECMRKFYENYTIQNGPEKSFHHLAKLQLDYPEFIPGCHYISHGIGHGALKIEKDFSKAFKMLDGRGLFKNIATCGNGYYHGVIEEYAKDETDPDKLIILFKNLLSSSEVTKGIQSLISFHGIGHTALIQSLYNAEDALYICKNITDSVSNKFECYTGIFMEMGAHKSLYRVTSDGKFELTYCKTLISEFRPACYMEQSSIVEYLVEKTGRRDFSKNILHCKNITDTVDRMSCVKLNAIRSVRIARHEDVKTMCANTTDLDEKIYCTGVTASKIASSLNLKRDSRDYAMVVRDICGTIEGTLYRVSCFKMNYTERENLFYTSPENISVPLGSFSSIRNYIKTVSRFTPFSFTNFLKTYEYF